MLMMKTLVRSSVLGIAWWVSAMPLSGQTIERDTTITGPRGQIDRTPGRDPAKARLGRAAGSDQAAGRNVRTAGASSAVAGRRPEKGTADRGALAAAALDSAHGRDWSARAGLRVRIAGRPHAQFLVRRRRWRHRSAVRRASGGPGPGGPPGGPAPPPDEVALMTQRLQSFYWNNRKEAAYTLGPLGDPRAVPSLIHVLKYDLHKDVRIAAAIALGEIGGSEAAIALERSSIYDHKEDVRHAAATALERLNAKAKAAAADVAAGGEAACVPLPPEPTTPSPFRRIAGDRASTPAESPAAEPGAAPAQADPAANQPPPPPTPVTGNPGSGNG